MSAAARIGETVCCDLGRHALGQTDNQLFQGAAMLMRRFGTLMFFAGLMIHGPGVGWAQTTARGSGQDFPNKPIRIVASAPGGNGDFMARVVAQETSGGFGQPVIVDNRNVVALIDVVSRAAPDG